MGLFATNRTTAERFAADVRNLVTHADELLRMTSNHAGDSVTTARKSLNDARQRLGDKVSQMRDIVDRAQSTATTQSKRAVKATDSYVREHPWYALGIGLAIGAAIGLLSLWSTRR